MGGERWSGVLGAIALLGAVCWSCSSGSGGHSGPACFVEDDTGSNVKDGCFCYLDPDDPNIATETRQRVSSCKASDLSPKAICCQDPSTVTNPQCGCFQTNCEFFGVSDTCVCGLGETDEMATCSSGTRCCIDDTGSCACDSDGTECATDFGQNPIASCDPATIEPSCRQINDSQEQVDSCSN
jgi:hypothetical protein